MLKPYLDLVRRELAFILCKDRRRGVLLLFAAAAYLVLFGLLYFQGVANRVPLLIVDECNTAASRRLARSFGDADGFAPAGFALTQEAQAYLLDSGRGGRHKAALVIPHDFGKKLECGQSSNILLLLEGSNLVISSNVAIAALDVLHEYNKRRPAP